MINFLCLLATWFGVGLIKKAPGTMGTLFAIPAVYGLSLTGPIYYMGFIILFIPLSIVAAQVYEKKSGVHDAQEVVIDEVIGFLITMAWLPINWKSIAIGFFMFRILDILKPGPIGYLDRHLTGGFGIVMDDVVAGLISNLILQTLYTQTSWLGEQLVVFTS